MNYKNYYDILGVPKTAAEKDIKSTYRRLARKWHPDANPDNAQAAEERFKEIQEAYDVLGDTEKRRKYDALSTTDWQQAAQRAAQYRQQRSAGGGGSGFDQSSGFSDFFDAFFSGMGRRQEPSASRAQDLETPVEIALSEAMYGGRKSVSLQIEELCPRCKSTGIERGRICAQCHGTGRYLATKHFDVNIPKGVRAGQRIRLANQGSANTAGQRGDLYLIVNLTGDDKFTRKGDDIYVDVPVSIYDLVLGSEVRVPTLGGEVTMTIPPGSQNHRLLRLAGKGMPKPKDGGNADQYVRLIGMLPQSLSDKEIELYRKLASIRSGRDA